MSYEINYGDSWYIQLSKDENVIRNISFDRCDAAIDKVHKTNVTSANDVIKVFRQNNINNSIIEIAYKQDDKALQSLRVTYSTGQSMEFGIQNVTQTLEYTVSKIPSTLTRGIPVITFTLIGSDIIVKQIEWKESKKACTLLDDSNNGSSNKTNSTFTNTNGGIQVYMSWNLILLIGGILLLIFLLLR